MTLERMLVSTHTLTSDYSRKSKIKTIALYWVVGLVVLALLHIPQVEDVIQEYCSRSFADFLINGSLIALPLFLLIGSVVTFLQRHSFDELHLYNTGINFVNNRSDAQGHDNYADYNDVELSYGNAQSSFFISAPKAGVKMTNYAWTEFTYPDVLENNLKRYGHWR
ncbi:hypothetical protein CRD60_03945 [Bifidobacterium aemilianum]|uniref:YcxB-like protein domain-containing protein n=1 Tax=Bifidobacterium aemilianum TaxID=2493120 RepID=A0A366K7Q7_9BIFI|nr:hypothetical protein [Bifidobacterium aemilianum]RBP97766.1 hypothetical protein CRD60_03945 [Bifidobacterium aemilianum]